MHASREKVLGYKAKMERGGGSICKAWPAERDTKLSRIIRTSSKKHLKIAQTIMNNHQTSWKIDKTKSGQILEAFWSDFWWFLLRSRFCKSSQNYQKSTKHQKNGYQKNGVFSIASRERLLQVWASKIVPKMSEHRVARGARSENAIFWECAESFAPASRNQGFCIEQSWQIIKNIEKSWKIGNQKR